jgi:hypothetical protein
MIKVILFKLVSINGVRTCAAQELRVEKLFSAVL